MRPIPPHLYDPDTRPLASTCRCGGRVDDLTHDPFLVARYGPDGDRCPIVLVTETGWGRSYYTCTLHHRRVEDHLTLRCKAHPMGGLP